MAEQYKTFKIPIPAEKIAIDSLMLANNVHVSGYRPDATIAIWRGGAATAAYVTGGLKYYNINPVNFSAQAKSYGEGVDSQSAGITVNNMEEIVRALREVNPKCVLAIDDIFDTGRTWHAFRHILTRGLRRSEASDVSGGRNNHAVYEFVLNAKNESYMLRVPLVGDIEPVYADVRIGAPYWKPHANKTEHKPDFFVEPFNINEKGEWPWIVFAWEAAEDLTKEELMMHFPDFRIALDVKRA